ncbi:MAG: alpha/beta fold hydrolase [Flammeovirgaceae bacterium]
MRKIIQNIAFVVLVIILLVVAFNFHLDIPVQELKQEYTNAQSQFIDVDGMQVHYRDEGAGMPIVLLHGTGASLHTWDDWSKELTKKYRVIRLDLPAFGLTGPHPSHDYRLETYASFLHQFIHKLSLDSLYLGGNSLGGNISWFYAAQYPEKVRKLLLLAPSGYPDKAYKSPSVFQLAKTPVVNQILQNITPKWFIRNNLQQVYFDGNKVTEEVVTRYHKMALRAGNRAAFIARAQTTYVDHAEKLKNIDIPTLLLWGKEDLWIPATIGDKFQTDLPNAKLVVLNNVGHVPMEEAPTESLAPVLTFLAD